MLLMLHALQAPAVFWTSTQPNELVIHVSILSFGAQEPAAAGRLWLTGTLQSNAGLLGLMKCARAEPRGGALRSVMDASSKYSLHIGDRCTQLLLIFCLDRRDGAW